MPAKRSNRKVDSEISTKKQKKEEEVEEKKTETKVSSSASSKSILPRPKSKIASQVEDLKRAIRKKEDWMEKLKDPIIKGRYIEEAIAQGASKEAVDVAIQEMELFELKETLFNFDEIVSNHSIFHVDGLIPEALKKSLETHLDQLANAPVKDFHPGSDDKVLDLIHPSLFPYIKGVTLTYEDLKNPPKITEKKKKEKKTDQKKKTTKKKQKKKKAKKGDSQQYDESDEDKPEESDEDKNEQSNEEDQESENETRMISFLSPLDRALQNSNKEKDRWGRPIENSKYQWLPAVYSVDAKNRVKITSYINNLDRDEYPEIYEDCEKIFEKLLPTIDACIEKAQNSYKEELGTSYYRGGQPEEKPIKLKGPRTYQVITKACNYVLKPGETYEGNWHIEGMTHERILVSALYYYSSSPNIRDAGLSFRVENGYSDESGDGNRRWSASDDLGTIRTNQDRCIVFSNEFQHKVTSIENTSKTKTASRKILCFFVVDPQHPIVSSADVPPQQWERMRRKLIKTMLLVFRRLKMPSFPKDVLLKIVDFAKIGITWEEALERRVKLMKERKFFVDEMNRQLEREFSLCEH